MLETSIQFGKPPIAISVVNANAPLIDTHSDTAGRRAERERQTASVADETARVAQAQAQAQEAEVIAKVLDRLNEVATQVAEQRQQLLLETQQLSVELAIAVATQAIGAAIQSGDFPIESLVKRAIERLGPAGSIVVRLHPDDLNLLQRRLGDSRDQYCSREVRFEADASLERGDCRADTRETGIWCKMQAQLDEMRQRLVESLGDAETERRKNATDNSGLRRFPDRRQTA
jgi:flagellar biosynthesis/type III secretory pathway protein FliH